MKNYETSLTYEGEYKDGKEDGLGILKWRNGTVEKCQYQQGQIHGYSVIQYPDEYPLYAMRIENRITGIASDRNGYYLFEKDKKIKTFSKDEVKIENINNLIKGLKPEN